MVASAAFDALLQGQSASSTTWISGNIMGWKELDYIPCRVFVMGGPVSSRTIVVEFDHHRNRIPGIQNLTAFTPSANVIITSPPVLDAPPNSGTWSYTFTIHLTDRTPGFVEFRSRLAAGSHLNVGSSLALRGSPSLGSLQIHKPGPEPGRPDLAVIKTGPATAAPDEVITYTLFYTNKATATDRAIGVQLSDVLPSQVTYVPNSASAGGTLVGNTLTWDLGDLDIEGSGTVTYQVRVKSGLSYSEQFSNYAQILSAEDDADYVDNNTSVRTVVIFNRPPVANDDSYRVDEDGVLTTPASGVLGNDTDADGNALTAILLSSPANGTLTFNADGSFIYTPNANYNGPDSFTYKANDGALDSAVAQVTINVDPVNDPPLANKDAYNTNEDMPLAIAAPGVLGNDTDIESDELTTSLVDGPAHGTLTLNADGSFLYSPALHYNGPDGFTYRANDGEADSGVAVVSIMVNPVNDAPVARDDAFSVNEDETLTIAAPGTLLNDTDVEGDSLNAVLVSGPGHGTLSLNSNGSFTYTPVLNYNGPDNFSYKANDGALDSGVATVTITVRPINDAPVANDDVYSVLEDDVLTVSAPGILINDTDVDGDSLRVRLLAGPSHGTVNLSPKGAFVYTPAPNYAGSDSFTYIANDDAVDSGAATVSITVTPVNDPPAASNDSYTLNEDTTFTLPASGVLANDTDIEADALTAVLIAGPNHGTLALNSDGSFSYVPNANYNGSDSFTYKAHDGMAESGVATVSLAILAVNDAPAAGNDNYTTSEDTTLNISAPGVLTNDSDLDGDSLTALVITPPNHGALTLNADGSFSYAPNPNYNGPDSFSYKANDGTADSAPATVSITITPINDLPAANDNAYRTDEDTILSITAPGILANDTDEDGDPLIAVLVAGPSHGSVSLNADGSFSYTPGLNYNGADSFTYKANDGVGDSGIATVSIIVDPINDPPVARDDSFTINEDTILTMPAPGVLINDTDVDSALLIAVLVSAPVRGTLTLLTNGSFLYEPNTNYHGADTFTYRVNDGTADSSVATVTITVNPIDDAPVAANDAYSVNEDTPLNVAATMGVLANDTDVETNTLTAILMNAPAHGTLTLNVDGSFSYQPAVNYHGTDTFTYRANDGLADSGVAMVTITINPINDPPVAADDSYNVNEDALLSVAAISGVLANDTDVETNALSALLVSGPIHGTLALNADGSFSYRPNANYHGNDSFTYKANDGTADSGVATVTITINPINDPPVTANDAYQVNEDALLNIAALTGVLANDTDIETNTLSAILITGPVHGSLTLNANGSFSYQPIANYYGADGFTYKANDGTADSDAATVAITVNAVNDAPVAVNDAYSVNEDTLLEVSAVSGVLSNDTDVESEALSAILISEPAHGTLTLNGNGSFNYRPAADYYGTDTFTYKANDGTADSGVATVTITIDPINDPPVAVNDAYAVNEDALLEVPATSGLLANDRDAETNSLTAILVSQPAHGVLALSADGSFTYRPDLNYCGSDSFTYKANDGAVDSALAVVAITINPVNDAPVAANDAYSINEDNLLSVPALTGVLANDGDIETNTLSAILASAAAHGSVILHADGSFNYNPDANYNGPDSFTYKAHDGVADSEVVTVTIAVNSVNDAPSFVKGPNQLVQQNASTQTVPSWAASISPGPADEAGQTLTFLLTADNSALFAVEPGLSPEGTLSYTPAAGAFGIATITVLLKDNGGTANGGLDTSAPQTFTITINAPPVVNITAPADGTFYFAPANISVVAEASDPDGVVTNVVILQNTNQLASLQDEPYFTVWNNVPAGQYQFSARATDNTGATGQSSVVNVTVLEQPPIVIVTPMHLNRQTGLYEHTIRVLNPTAYSYEAIRVLIRNLPPGTGVYNASGETNSVPYVQSNLPIPPGGSVDFTIEYYANRLLEPTLEAQLVSASPPTNPTGTVQQVSRAMRLSDGTFLIEFNSLVNRIYCVQYTKDMTNWKTVTPTLMGTGTRIQWLDNGPPKTETHPNGEPSRIYRLMMLP